MSKVKSIGHYFLGKTIGEGTFGKVKLGTHQLTGLKVAIKVLEKARIADAADVERVTREIHILKLIRHPAIIQLYEIIETPKQLYLIMEYAPGGEVFNYIVAQTRVEEREACRFFQQLLSGVEYISGLGIAHRDLKPENLLLDHQRNIKIVDFGLSNTFKPGELLETACGSPCYAAPEMIAGKHYQGEKADIWSCGVILFAMVSGCLPFEDSNTAELSKKILSGDYQCPSHLSAPCKELIAHILTTDPEKRYTISDIRTHPWASQVQQEIPSGLLIGYTQILLDREVTELIKQYGFDADHARSCLEANKHNHVTTTYYLLLQKKMREGGRVLLDDGTNPKEQLQIAESRQASAHPPVPVLDLSLFPLLPRRAGPSGKRTTSTADVTSKERSPTSHRSNVSHEVIKPQLNADNPYAASFKSYRRTQTHSLSPVQPRSRTRKHLSVLPRERVSPVPRPPVGPPPIRRRVRTKTADVSDSSLEYGSAILPSMSPKMHLPDSLSDTEPTGAFYYQSARDPEEVLEEIRTALNLARVSTKQVRTMQTQEFVLKCLKRGIQFEIEVVGKDSTTSVRFKRVAGDLKEYRTMCQGLLRAIAL